MTKIIIKNDTTPATPDSGKTAVYVDSTTKKLVSKNDAGVETAYGGGGAADAVNSATTEIDLVSATAPSADQVLTATSSTAATWQTPSTEATGLINGFGTTSIDSEAAAPTVGQILIANSATDMSWQAAPSSGATDIDGLSDAASDGSSYFFGTDSGLVDDGTTNQNIGIGVDTLKANTSGFDNVAIGGTALAANIIGQKNFAVGAGALRYATGSYNTAIGFNASHRQTTPSTNTSIGTNAGMNNATGGSNTAIGFQALTGVNGNSSANNTGLGYNAGAATTTGGSNTYIGTSTAATGTTGSRNILLGYAIDLPLAATDDYLSIGDIITGDISVGNVSTLGVFGAGQFATGSLPTASSFEGFIAYDTTTNEIKFSDGSTWAAFGGGGGGSGDVVGPSASLDNEIARFDSTTGKLLQAYTSSGPTINDAGIISSAHSSYAQSERFGANTTITGTESTALGYSAEAFTRATSIGHNSESSGNQSVSIGYASSSTASVSTAIGGNADATADSSVAIGYNSGASGSYGVCIGREAVDNGFANTLCFGRQATAYRANSWNAGSINGYVNYMTIGSGEEVFTGTAREVTITTSNRTTQTDTAAAGFVFHGGAGTGTGASGGLKFKIFDIGTTGAVTNTTLSSMFEVTPAREIIQNVEDTATTDGTMWNNSLSFYLDETANVIKAKSKDSGATVRTVTINGGSGTPVAIPSSIPTAATLAVNEVQYFITEGANALNFKMKYADGTTKRAKLPLYEAPDWTNAKQYTLDNTDDYFTSEITGEELGLSGATAFTISVIVDFNMVANDEFTWLSLFAGTSTGKLEIYRINSAIRFIIDGAYTDIAPTRIDGLYHLVFVYDGGLASDILRAKIYHNGSDATTTGSGTIPTSVNVEIADSQLGIGNRYSPGANYYDGSIQEISIYNKALSGAEVTSLYNSGSYADPTAVSGCVSSWWFGDNPSDNRVKVVDNIGYNDLTGMNLDSGVITTI